MAARSSNPLLENQTSPADARAVAVDGPAPLDVFVSYSRADEAFVRRLDAALQQVGKGVWVDWEDIPPTADWRARIFAGIDAARTFVAVLSPDLIASEICREELAHASQSNKRVVPVLRREVDRRATPEELLAPNWIFFRDTDDFERSVRDLVEALETDLDWLDSHARLLVRATEWHRERRDPSFLLRGRDLREAETWLAQQGSHREAATPLQADFIVASRKGAARRQRVVLSGILLALAVAVALAVVALVQRNDAIAQSKISRSRELAATAISQLASDPELSLRLALEAANVRETPQAQDALRRSLRESHLRLTLGEGTGPATSAEFRGDGMRVVSAIGREARIWHAQTGRLLRRLRGHRARLTAARFSTEGKRVVTASADGTARVWDARAGSTVAVLRGHRASVTDAMFSPDGTRVLTTSEDRTGRLWDTRSGKPLAVLHVEAEPTDATFSRDGSRVVVTSADGYLRIWNGDSGKRVLVILANELGKPVYSPDLGPAGKLVAAASWDDARVWDATTGRLVKVLSGHESLGAEIWVHSAAFSADGRFLVTAGIDSARVWQSRTWRQIAIVHGHSGDVEDARFSSDGTRILTKGRDGTARVWDSITGDGLAILRVPGGAISSAKFADDGNRIVTANNDGARVWEVSGFRPLRRIRPPKDPPRDAIFYINDAVFGPGGRVLATLTDRPAIHLWSVATGEHMSRLRGHGSAVDWPRHSPDALAFSRDGTRIVTIADKAAIVWDIRTGERVARLHGPQIWSAMFSSKRTRVLTTSPDGNARVWNATTGEVLRTMKIGPRSDSSGLVVSSPSLAVSPSGRLVAGHNRRGVSVWDIDAGNRSADLDGTLSNLLGALAFNSDGSRVYAYTGDDRAAFDQPSGTRRAGVWNATTGATIAVFRGRTLGDGAFSADGQLVLTHDGDTVQVWEARTGKRLASMRGHGTSNTDSLHTASFSPDGRLVITSGADGTAKLWDAETGERVAVLRQLNSGFGISSARFSPDGKVIVAVASTSARLYACAECGGLSELRRLAEQRVNRSSPVVNN